MKYQLLAICALLLASLSCGQYVTPTSEVPTSTDTGTPLPATLTATVPTATPLPVSTGESSAIVRAVVNVRSAPDGDVIGYLTPGESVTVSGCTDEWCNISSPIQGFVWRGCLSDNPAALGCTAK